MKRHLISAFGDELDKLVRRPASAQVAQNYVAPAVVEHGDQAYGDENEPIKTGFAVSQYSGPLGPVHFKQESGIPSFVVPPFKKEKQAREKKKFPHPLSGRMENGYHVTDVSPGITFHTPVEKKAAAGLVELLKQAGNPLTPAGRLTSSQTIGQPKMSAPPGPSIAEISKPKGYGEPMPGATKDTSFKSNF